MSHQSILSDLKAKKYAPIYLLHGEESYFIDLISNYIEKHTLSEGEKAFNQAILYGKDTDFKQITDEARQFPMMSSYRVIILKEAQEMRTLKMLESYTSSPSPQSILVICHKNKKVDKRNKWVKNIQKSGVEMEAKKIYDNQLPAWIRDYLSVSNVNIGHEAAALMSEYLGTNLSKVANELDKLLLNIGQGSEITVNHVREQIGISKDYNVFELQRAIGQKNAAKIFRIIQNFAENPKANPLPMVIGNLYNYFSKLWITISNVSAPDRELQKLLGLPSPFFVKDYKSAARNLGPQKIKYSFDLLRKADLASKGYGMKSADPKSILTDLTLALLDGNV